MAGSLKNRSALVTGGSKGVGKGIALKLARSGCNVVVNFHSDGEGAKETVAQIHALGAQAIAIEADVSDSRSVGQLFEQALNSFPMLDLLVNNAAVQTWASLLDLKEADWDRDIGTNLKGCFLCTQLAARHMVFA